MQHFASLIEQFGLLILFLNVLLEQGGLPLPSWPLLIAAGALTISGIGIVPSVIAAALGSIIADAGWYIAGARWGHKVLGTICRVSLSPDSCVRRTQDVFTRIGPQALLFVKFLPGLGLVTVAMAGITGVSFPLFVALDVIGSAMFVLVPIIVGRVFHDAVDALIETLSQFGQWGAVLLAVTLIAYIAVRWAKRQAFIRQLRMDRITVAELIAMIDDGKTPVIFDVRSAEARTREGMIPGAHAASPADIAAALSAYPRDVEVIVYCSCPNEASAAVAAGHLKRAGFKTIRPLLGGVEAWTKAGRPLAAA
jgi:membrane protein DedA with SNARE-associated domain/rhodanese-related sulfurtransferase